MSVSVQKQLLLQADDAVKTAAYSPRKLVLIHSGVLAALNLLALALQFVLSQASEGAGGLAGLYYGYEGIPGEWLAEIACREWIEGMCAEFCNEAYRPIADEGDTHNAGNEEMDALEKSFCRRMGVKNIEEYLPILVKSIEEGNTPRNFGRKTLEMLMKHLKIHGYLPEPESQPSDKDGE